MSKNTELGNLVNGLFVSSANNVGVGTKTPTVALDVNGSGYINSGLQLGSGYQLTFADSGTTVFTAIEGSSFSASFSFLRFLTNGSEQMRITSAGRVGIGTVSPVEKLDIYAVSGAAAFINLIGNANTGGISCVVLGQNSDDGAYFWNRKSSFMSLGTNNTERVRITSAGNVGINITNPSTPLHVNGAVTVGNNTGNPFINITGGSGGGAVGTGPYLQIFDVFNFNGWIQQIGAANGRLAWFGYSGSWAERMTLLQNGNLGIGTTSPAKQLEVYGTAGLTTGQIKISSAGSTSGKSLYLGSFGNTAYINFGGTFTNGWASDIPSTAVAGITMDSVSGDSNIAFATTTTNNTGPSERMRITANGNVGIGNTSPATRLHVTGTVSAVDLQLSGTFSATYTTSDAWTNWQVAIPAATLVGGATYLVTLFYITDNWPWQVSCSFTYSPVNSNGGGANNTFTPLISNHTGDGAMIYARNVAAFGQVCGALQIYFAGFAKNIGSLTVRAFRLT